MLLRTNIVALVLMLTFLSGCFGFSPELIKELAKDNASFCGRVTASGGAGAMPLASGLPSISGGYGTSALSFCRTNTNAGVITMNPDGTISITHNSDNN